MKLKNIIFVKYTCSFRDAALQLLSQLWMHLKPEEQKACFHWRYEQNPYAKNALIYLAVDGDKVIGFRAFVEQTFISGASLPIKLFTPADAIVLPAYRRQGIFYALGVAALNTIRESTNEQCIVVNLSSNEYSTPANIKHGWLATNGIKRFAIKVSLKNYFLRKITHAIKPNNTHCSKNGFIFEISSILKPADMAKCARNYRLPGKISHIRDVAYFKWRYSFQSEKFFFSYCYKDDEIMAYIVLEKVSDTQYLLLEFFAKDSATLAKTIHHVINRVQIPFLRTWVLNDSDLRLLSYCGFIPAPVKLWHLLGKKRLPILVRPINNIFRDDDFFINGKDSRDINNWQFFIADRH